jgi:hypothetical protein
MKNLKLITVVAILMMMTGINRTNAAIIYVEENGIGGAYTSIGVACQAAQSGDKILVYPRANNAYYQELNGAFTVPDNVEVISAVPGQRFRVETAGGSVIIGNNCKFSMGEINITDSGNPTDYKTIIGNQSWVADCLIDSGSVYGGDDSKFDNDSILYGTTIINSGRVSGCYCSVGLYIAGHQGNDRNDTILVVGNYIYGDLNFYYSGSEPFNEYVFIANNYIINVAGMVIDGLCQGGTGMNSIINNIIIHRYPINESIITISPNSSTANLNISNNLLISEYPASIGPIIDILQPMSSISSISYNYMVGLGGSIFANGFINDGTNVLNSNTTIDAQGHLLAGSDAINGGSPNVNYLNLDLTRNSAGCFGGSYSRSNFNTPGIGNPRVLFMTAPRTAFSTQSINISADGVAK